MSEKRGGLFISIEGGEGTGKGTQTKLLADYLRKKYSVETGREPGSTAFGEALRKVLQDPKITKVNEFSELFLFSASRAEYTKELVIPALEKGKIFISDRFFDSLTAYQGYGLGIDLDLIKKVNRAATFNIEPHLTFLIDIEPELGLSKITGDEFSENKDKIESRDIDYHQKVNEGFREIAKQNPHRFRIIKHLQGNPQKMYEEIVKEVEKFIAENDLDKILLKPNPQNP